ncbi:hypothetical protein C9994_05565 [Marivirga lumbricoides]|uniref:L,D-TPase catalytic domain-containing protein n=1 Tax=Marivirga lumbricoides TaxID=1046115 RepID=A0A2T4DSY9_9BACT|nr:hypothetical protein C9994_05565 [Marivirga lumbricoides]
MTRFFLTLSIFTFLILASCDKDKSSQGNSAPITLVATDSIFFKNALVLDTARKNEVVKKLINFYQKNGAQTKWLLSGGATNLFHSLIETIGNAEDYGLYSETYNYNYLKSQSKAVYAADKIDFKELCNLDRDATASFLLFVIHLNKGRILEPGYLEKPWFKGDQEGIETLKLLSVDHQETITHIIDTLQPNFPFYVQLRDQLRKLNHSEPRDIVPFQFDDLENFEVGFKDKRVKYLRNNLNQWGVEADMATNPLVVDTALVENIKDFQASFDMKADGLPGESTLRFLNMQDDDLKSLIALNLERMRWIPEGIGENLIMVNIPEYKLRVYRTNEVTAKVKVIVGEEMKPTPVFSDTLSHIVFNPTWTVPQSIIWEEMVPKLRKNPGHYEEDFKIYQDNVEVDPYMIDWLDMELKKKYYFRFVQQPGPSNSLGEVKFMFPNNLSIYMHDTPADVLFDRNNRDLSHGCIRLNKPFKFANYLLSDNENWSKEKMYDILQKEEPEKIYLDQRYHVQIAYLTAWITAEGRLKLFDDIYGFDKVQLEKLNELKQLAKKTEKDYS